jgi:DNA segregation ATPase FtsK/SpoIIIE, S-DNA-T family
LLGRGDMLFRPPDASRMERVQGTYVYDDEISRIIRYWKGIRSLEGMVTPNGDDDADAATPQAAEIEMPDLDSIARNLPKSQPLSQDTATQPTLFAEIDQMKVKDSRDELFDEAVNIVKSTGRGSVSLLQRKLRIGYSRASRLVDQLEEAGILGADQGGNQGRVVLGGSESAPAPANHPQPSASNGVPPRIIGGAGEDDAEPPVRPRVWM